MVVSAPDGSYRLEFKGMELDWRLARAGTGEKGPDFELIGYPDLRLTIWRRPDPGPEFKDEAEFSEKIPAPNAFGGSLLLTASHEIVGAFPADKGFILLRFEHLPVNRDTTGNADKAVRDIRRIAASFRAPSP